ncbi:MAG: hypothetical protein Fur0044_43020 [Anaerolineae bacterium]
MLIPLAIHPLLRQLVLTDVHAASAQLSGKAMPELIQATALYTLYDGSLGTTPDQQDYFTYQAIALFATQTITTGGTILNTLPFTDDYAGYVKSNQTPILDRTSGYTINFTTQVFSESHSNDTNSDGIDDRAGFSVTVLSSDSEGIELGFWTNQIWAQEDDTNDPNDLLTHAEGVTFTTTSLTSYSLAILSNTYTLSANGSPILSGSLRNYSAFIPPSGLPNPYTSTNFIFLGDNSSSARARIKLAAVSISTTVTTNYLPVILKNS